MKIQSLVWREIFERKNQLATSFLAILLGVSVIVAMKNITFYSEKAVAYQLDASHRPVARTIRGTAMDLGAVER